MAKSKSLLLSIKTKIFWPQRVDVVYPWGVDRLRLGDGDMFTSHMVWSYPRSHPGTRKSFCNSYIHSPVTGVVHGTETSLVISACDCSELGGVAPHWSWDVLHNELTISFTHKHFKQRGNSMSNVNHSSLFSSVIMNKVLTWWHHGGWCRL